MKKNPLVSVILPTYNGERFLPDAIASIRANNYAPLEILVVDDASTDNTREVADTLGVRVLRQSHSGCPATGRNTGIRASNGALIAFLDQDDEWTRDKLALQVPKLVNDAALQVVWSHSQKLKLEAESEGRQTFEPFDAPVDYRLVSSALFRRNAFEQVGWFDESLQYYGDDTDWYIRAREMNVPMEMLKAVTLYWRIHDTNASHRNLRNHAHGYDRALTEVLKKALERRRIREIERQ